MSDSKRSLIDNSEIEKISSAEDLTEHQEALNSKTRILTGKHAKLAVIIAASMSMFQICTNSFFQINEMQKCNIHVAFILALTYLMYPALKKGRTSNPGIMSYLLCFVAVACPVYIALRYNADYARTGIASTLDLIVGGVLILVILEGTRRVMGPVIPIIAIVFLAYALLGSHFPGILRIRSFTLKRVIYRITLTTDGLWGSLVIVSASYLFLFILFGSFLDISGGSGAFNDIGFAIGGHMRGGPAQVAVISSALMGSISGSAVANVMTTGSFTIPLMKKVGYSKEFSGGVEAAASTGGVIMPPVMGATAFIMASTLGVSYNTIAAAAIIPALLYYISIAISVDIEAQRNNLKGLDKDQIPKITYVLKREGIYLLPVVVIVVLLVRGKTPLFAGFLGILSAFAVSWVHKETRMGFNRLVMALERGAKGAVSVGIACCCCSFIVCVATMTGLGSTLAANIMALSGGSKAVALLLIAVIVLVMSMGMPGNAVYIVVAVIAAPALVEMGFNKIAAHFFVMWIGTMSNMTPPVCMASFAASSLAGGSLSKTALTGLKLALAGLLIPFIFAFNPIMLLQGGTLFETLWSFVTGVVGVYALATGLHGFWKGKLPIWVRSVFLASAVTLIIPTLSTDFAGIGLLVLSIVISMVYNRFMAKSSKT